jgi:hypothetical protein
MARFGFSTAKLFVTHFDESMAGRPFVVKVDELEAYERERTAIANLLVYFVDADVHYYKHKDYGAIAYPLQKSGSGQIETFEDALSLPTGTDERLCTALKQVYGGCCRIAHNAKKVDTRKLGEEYLRYHRSAKTDNDLCRALGNTFDREPFDFYGEKIVDPRAAKQVLDSREFDITVGPIHGDLHGSNIVFDEEDRPHLIDFAWGDRSGHVMKDFVMLENSLRFFAFPRYFDPDIHARVDSALLVENGVDLVRELATDTPLEAEYMRLASLVEIIRDAARAAGGDSFFDEYLLAQFMILYRLLQYPTYPFHATLRSLGGLGQHILATV